ncbi:MAG: hypothetical protein FWG21_00620 [Oscillospiraceae bacterium]|nr:hypothetical protein [Oscillospiraceae bacterium]
MSKNIWMTSCLLLGCLLSVALISSLYTYCDSILNRMITKNFEMRQIEENVHPLFYSVQYRYMSGANELNADIYEQLSWQEQEYFSALDLPYMLRRESFKFTDIFIRQLALDNSGGHSEKTTRFTLSALYDINEHIEITHGRRPQPSKREYEVMVTPMTMFALNLSLNSRYEIAAVQDLNGNPIVIRIVGVFEPNDPYDLFWFGTDYNSIHLDPDVYDNSLYLELAGSDSRVLSSNCIYYWNYALDYHVLSPDMINGMMDTVWEQTSYIRTPMTVTLSNMDILETFVVQRQQIYIFLLVLLIPIVALLAFFIVMISGLVFEYDRNERTLMQSRGAMKSQVFAIYVYQSIIISVVSGGIGIPLSVLFCRLIGSANGFLEFVSRTSLKIMLSRWSIIYAAVGIVVFLMSMLLPLSVAREDSIVAGKRKNSRSSKTFFDRYFIDVILLVLSGVGLYTYSNISEIMTEAGISAEDTPINPFLFIISSFFIFGCCLLFARVYPKIIELIFRIGQKSWSPVIYSSLINTSRIRSRGRFLMVFLVATVSMGIFGSAAARTINRNYEDRIYYGIGADVRLREKWESVDPDPQFTPEGAPISKEEKDLIFLGEPSYEKYLNMEGIRSCTKVYSNSRAQLRRSGKLHPNLNVMCIVPHEFTDVAWYRSDIYPYSVNYMMNAMTINPHMILVSENFMEKLNMKQGETVGMRWDNNTEVIDCIIYDSFKYFPSYDPKGTEEDEEPPYLIIMNYQLVEHMYRIEPYEVWLSLEDGYSSADIYRQLVEDEITLITFESSSSDVVDMKNNPSIQGMNGILTLSFLVTIIITVSGFMIYWVFDLKNRQLQMGIIRSMGMSTFEVISILLWEQAFMSFVPMFAGMAIGGISSDIFVPMFEFGVTASEAVPPYRVFIYLSDYLRIGVIVTSAILVSMIIIGVMISRIKISQTLKLGED